MEVIRGHLHVGCPLSGGCPLFGGSAIGGSTVFACCVLTPFYIWHLLQEEKAGHTIYIYQHGHVDLTRTAGFVPNAQMYIIMINHKLGRLPHSHLQTYQSTYNGVRVCIIKHCI